MTRKRRILHMSTLLLVSAIMACSGSSSPQVKSDNTITGGGSGGSGRGGDGGSGSQPEVSNLEDDRSSDYTFDTDNGAFHGGGEDRDGFMDNDGAPVDQPDGAEGEAIVFIEKDTTNKREEERRAPVKSEPKKKNADKKSVKLGDGGQKGQTTEDVTTTTTEVAHKEPEKKEGKEKKKKPSLTTAVYNPGQGDTSWTEFQLIYQEIGPVYTHPGELPHLTATGRDVGEAQELELPLEKTHVDANLVGPVGRVILNQRYGNPYKEVIEAVYVFPLPENSAVDGMRMIIGERVIEGVVRDRKTARRMYEHAKSQGYTAALLEQERPNIFTQSVANIAPGKKISVEIRYVQDLTYDNGGYEFVFPMVVGPRYAPENVADASRIQPAIVGKGQRSGTDITMSVRVDAGLPITSFSTPTHEVDAKLSDGKLSLMLKERDEIPNRDFVLRYNVAGEQPQVAVMSEWVKDKGYFTMVVQPPEADVNALVGTREVLFVVDVSGSMRGVPMALSQEAMTDMLRRLRPVDTFNIITFSSGTQKLFDTPRPANKHNTGVAMEFIDAMEAKGGTEMLKGVQAALTSDLEPGMHRHIIFMTDGYIGNEDEIIASVGEGVEQIAKKQATVRVYGFGVGSSTNRYLLEGIAHSGEGIADYALNREDPARIVQAFFHKLDSPVMTDVGLDFADLDVDYESFFPSQVPDLFASHPMIVHGTYTKAGKGTITLKGIWQGRELEIPVEVELSDQKEQHQGAMGTLWARSRVEQLERDQLFGADPDTIAKEIETLGIEFSIVTAYTSFIAIDESKTVGDGAPKRIDQATDLPEGVNPEGH